MTPSVYDTDYYQWLTETAQQLREKKFEQIDWDNLIEEIEDRGKSQKRALESLLTRLLEHLLKLSYWQSEKERSGPHWSAEIVNFRDSDPQTITRLSQSKTCPREYLYRSFSCCP